ncbi:MAG: hypothetical protein Fur0032_10830 [Terrimicrobiaceae bacterium]
MVRPLEYEDRKDTAFGWWLILTLVASLALHFLLWKWAGDYHVQSLSQEYYDKIVPRTFQIERAEIDPRLLEPEDATEKSQAMAPVPVALPEERIAFERERSEVPGPPAAEKLEKPLLSDTPAPPSTSLASTVEAAKAAGAESLLEDPEALRQALLAESPSAGKPDEARPPLNDLFAGGAVAPEGALRGGEQPGFSNLDDLLAQTGPLTPETAPILMPADLLFDYDSAELRAGALESIGKLGALMRRNPQAFFLIEGHTDSFGTDEYNLALSTRRADGVRDWLVANVGIDPARIQTVGLGESRLLAPANASVDDQQINRRVEIVIRESPAR